MTRRRFAFWLGLGLFNLSEFLRADGLDALAAAVMGDPAAAAKPTTPEHWTAVEDDTWRWFERENLVNGQWMLTGTTTPVNKETGERAVESAGYLADDLLPADMWIGDQPGEMEAARSMFDDIHEPDFRLPAAMRRSRHGRPPSKWLRSLDAGEIRIWLKTIEVPEADVSGMTYWEHLTRDHSFEPKKIEGLTIDEQAKLHAAAHYGY
jgi:hypothetical protein